MHLPIEQERFADQAFLAELEELEGVRVAVPEPLAAVVQHHNLRLS